MQHVDLFSLAYSQQQHASRSVCSQWKTGVNNYWNRANEQPENNGEHLYALLTLLGGVCIPWNGKFS